jgi:hypothetical protein
MGRADRESRFSLVMPSSTPAFFKMEVRMTENIQNIEQLKKLLADIQSGKFVPPKKPIGPRPNGKLPPLESNQ